jgi:hypothetical protein
MLQDILEKEITNILEKSIPELLKLYGRYSKVYLLRQEYRKKGFREEFWDFGHANMIDFLWDKMQEICKIIERNVEINKEKSLLLDRREKEEKDKKILEEEIDIEIKEEKEIEIKDNKRLLKLHHKLEQEELWNRRVPCLIKGRKQANIRQNLLMNIYSNIVLKFCLETKLIVEDEETPDVSHVQLDKIIDKALCCIPLKRSNKIAILKNININKYMLGDIYDSNFSATLNYKNTDKYAKQVAEIYLYLISQTLKTGECTWRPGKKIEHYHIRQCCLKNIINELKYEEEIIKFISDVLQFHEETGKDIIISCRNAIIHYNRLIERDKKLLVEKPTNSKSFMDSIKNHENIINDIKTGEKENYIVFFAEYQTQKVTRFSYLPFNFEQYIYITDFEHKHESDIEECNSCIKELRENLSYGTLHK